MKIRRIASSVALAAALALGATGCSLIAPQGTTEPYAPSDGIDVNLEGVDIRNLLLVADESGENFNVVFTAVNGGDAPALVRITFVAEGGSAEASADFLVEPGLTAFGNPEGDIVPTLVSIQGAVAGGTANAYFEVSGGAEVNREVPVLDGTLPEYRDYVISASQLRAIEKQNAPKAPAQNGQVELEVEPGAGSAQPDEASAE